MTNFPVMASYKYEVDAGLMIGTFKNSEKIIQNSLARSIRKLEEATSSFRLMKLNSCMRSLFEHNLKYSFAQKFLKPPKYNDKFPQKVF